MKIKFIIPGDRMKINEPMKITNECGLNKWGPFNAIDSIPAGTVLEVSQMYIRKNGWFKNSITFKIIESPELEKIIEAESSSEQERIQGRISDIVRQLEDMKKAGPDICFACYNKHTGAYDYSKDNLAAGSFFGTKYSFCVSKQDITSQLVGLHRDLKNVKRDATTSIKRSVFRVLISEIENIDIDLMPSKPKPVKPD